MIMCAAFRNNFAIDDNVEATGENEKDVVIPGNATFISYVVVILPLNGF